MRAAIFRMAWLAILIAAVGGCAPKDKPPVAPSPTPLTLTDEPPEDFTLSVTVLAPAGSRPAPNMPRYLRPARYIVEADRSLRARVNPSVTPTTYPRITRMLNESQMRALWWDLRDSGLLSDDHPSEIGAPIEAEPPQRATFILTYTARGHRRTLAIDAISGADAPGARRMVDRLADLAFVQP